MCVRVGEATQQHCFLRGLLAQPCSLNGPISTTTGSELKKYTGAGKVTGSHAGGWFHTIFMHSQKNAPRAWGWRWDLSHRLVLTHRSALPVCTPTDSMTHFLPLVLSLSLYHPSSSPAPLSRSCFLNHSSSLSPCLPLPRTYNLIFLYRMVYFWSRSLLCCSQFFSFFLFYLNEAAGEREVGCCCAIWWFGVFVPVFILHFPFCFSLSFSFLLRGVWSCSTVEWFWLLILTAS